jgi:hypothetical protein
MDEIAKKLDEQQKKIDAIYVSVEKTRTYFLWTLIITAVVVILPALGLMLAVPSLLSLYSGAAAGF